MSNLQQLVKTFKQDLDALHNDWKELMTSSAKAFDSEFLIKFATDVQNLDRISKQLDSTAMFKKQADLVHCLLSTLWGVPFV